MTKEEAAEFILREVPFRICSNCKGHGVLRLGTPQSKRCERCIPEGGHATITDLMHWGSGKVWTPGYVEACEVLEMDPPKATWEAGFATQNLHSPDLPDGRVLVHRAKDGMVTREEAIEVAKKTAARDQREMFVRNDYGTYYTWYRYNAGQEGRVADAGGDAFGVISCLVTVDGRVIETKDMK